MPVGFSANVSKARVATPDIATVGESTNVQIIRAKIAAAQEPFVVTKSTIIQTGRIATFTQSVKALKLVNKLEFDLTIVTSPSFLAGRISFIVLATRQNIGHGIKTMIFNATQGFTATVSSTKVKVTTLTTTQPISVSAIKVRMRTLTSGFSTALPPTFYSIFFGAQLTALKVKIQNFSVTQPLVVTRTSKVSITKNLAHVMLVAIRKEVPLFTETLTSSNVIHITKSMTPNKVLRSVTNQVGRLRHDFSVTQNATATTQMTIQTASRKRFATISTGLVADFRGQRVAALEALTTSIHTTANISRQVSTQLVSITQLNMVATLQNFVFKTIPTAVVTANATISNRLIKIMITTQQNLSVTLPKLITKQPFKVIVRPVANLNRLISIGRTTVTNTSVRIQVGKSWLLVLSASFTQSAAIKFTRRYTLLATQPTVALLNRATRKIVRVTERVTSGLTSVAIRIIGVPGTVILRNVESAYVKLRNIIPNIILRNWFK